MNRLPVACFDIAEDLFIEVRRLLMAADDGGSSAGWLLERLLLPLLRRNHRVCVHQPDVLT